MKNFLTLVSLGVMIITAANGATANCSNGECEFSYSSHYKYAKTHCAQILTFEQVETELLYFTILGTGQECKVTESRNEN
jgi:hypothetical protein